VLLASAGIAGATVSTSAPPYAQPAAGSIIYTFANLDSGSAGTLMEDNANNMNDGATVDTWAPYIFDNAGGNAGTGPVLQANEQWAFRPASSNAGGSITTGYGELVNRRSGLGLDITGSDPAEQESDGATVDQWQCFSGAANEQWTAIPTPGGSGYQVFSQFAGTYNGTYDGAYLGTDNEYCQPLEDNNGTPVMTRTDGDSNCTSWQIQRVSYEFATNPWGVAQGALTGTTDTQIYNCVTGYTMRTDPEFGPGGGPNYYAYTNLSDKGVYLTNDNSGTATIGSAQPQYYQAGNGHEYLNGQIALYCDPDTTSP
jgi:hypothetical protein